MQPRAQEQRPSRSAPAHRCFPAFEEGLRDELPTPSQVSGRMMKVTSMAEFKATEG